MLTTQTAFKEWAAVCLALAAGQQIIILRKGGIVEPTGDFQPDHPDFLLLPTYLHQSADGLKPDAEHWLQQAEALRPTDDVLVIRHYAIVAKSIRITSASALEAVRAEHIWSDQVVRERFHRCHDDSVHALLVRVHRLPVSVVMPVFPEYRGCKSWIDLEQPVDVHAAAPVLSDAEFHGRCRRILDSLTAKARQHP